MSVDSLDRIGIANHWVEGFTPNRAEPGAEVLAVTMLKHLRPQSLSGHDFQTGCLLLDQLPMRIGPEGGAASRPSRASLRLSGVRSRCFRSGRASSERVGDVRTDRAWRRK